VLAPLFESAATSLKGQLQLGKVDATANNALSARFGIKGFPHLKFLREGEVRNYNGARTTDGMVTFGREMSQPAVTQLKSVEQFNKLADAYPVSAVFFGVKQHGAERVRTQPRHTEQLNDGEQSSTPCGLLVVVCCSASLTPSPGVCRVR